MSQLLINQYLNELSTLKRVSGAQRESVVREAFKDLLKAWGKSQSLVFIPEHEVTTAAKTRIYVDGALLHDLRVPFGYWEAKDADDDLDEEIVKKFRRGYPKTNIVFEDSVTAVLIQNGEEVMRCPTTDGAELERLLSLFFAYQRPEIAEFRKAIVQFKADLPQVLNALRERIEEAYATNAAFNTAAAAFLQQAKDTINPAVTADDVREMLIQHVLTEDIFGRVFGNDDFHRENNVAKALYGLEGRFFRGDVKRQTLAALEPYYAAIRSTAALISSHAEKQGFLKAIYENFYKVYNPHAADRLGVVYTPNEIVRFMVESADWLCEKHFGKSLIDKGVEILDPATGTGTFIVELLEHFRGRPKELKAKYLDELHANEVAILPYYVANLNIEATYAAIEGEYAEFPGLCFVDTLDNVAALKIGKETGDLFGGLSSENAGRIARQNQARISVVIGNPPYNANQQNENENNKNRKYDEIDQRIKSTYIRSSAAKKTKLYDMYSRFFRWATDRLEADGIVAFVTNRSFIEGRTFDGFRKIIAEEFNEVWVLDLGGDVRANPKLSGTKHNVFGIQTGVAISFMVRRRGSRGCRVFYSRRPEYETAEEKLTWLSNVKLKDANATLIQPDHHANWLGEQEVAASGSIPLFDEETKRSGLAKSIFGLYSNGIVTARDEWTTDFDRNHASSKISKFISVYESERHRWVLSDGRLTYKLGTEEYTKALRDFVSRDIKWTSELENHLDKGTVLVFDANRVRRLQDRPYIRSWCYYDRVITHRLYRQDDIFPVRKEWSNMALGISGLASSKPFQALAVSTLPSYDLLEKTQFGSRWDYATGSRLDNITDWALTQFTERYGVAAGIAKDDIFAYVYAVLHDPIYRETYALNLKREFPRIPLYDDFPRWRVWGQSLLDLHIGYETTAPFGLQRIDTPDPKRAEGSTPAVKLRSDHETGVVTLDSETQLTGVPASAWRYVLGNRTAIDWVLDQHKEKTPKDPTIRARFNTYRFADYKEAVIALLDRVTTVSVETVRITDAMRALPR